VLDDLTLVGVLGFPVGHSRSPAMFEAAFRDLGLDDWRYVRLPVAPELFDETVRALPGSGYRGANVTMPHKPAALRLADEATDAARAIGAANALTFADGSVAADNTDAGGLLDALEAAGISVRGVRSLVLGAGGAARAAVWALREAGAAHVAVWNRTPGRARELARDLGVSATDRPEDADLLVNATSVGMSREPDTLERLGIAGLEPPRVVVDFVYSADGPTPVQSWGERAGAAVIDGMELLVRQGGRSFEGWTGHQPPLDQMRRAALGTEYEGPW
jgi:shikimate dehydrogenase